MSAIRCFARPLACTVSIAALLAAAPALAGTYTATDDTSLRNAITSANGDSDPSGTVTLSNNITMTTAVLPNITKPITIDTGSFTYTNTFFDNSGGVTAAVNLNGTTFSTGASLTLKGAFRGGTAGAGASGSGDNGMYVSGAGKTIVIDGILAGGAGGGLGGNGGTGFGTGGAEIITNNGTVTGGNAVNGTGGAGAGSGTGTLTNSGSITGGNGLTGGLGVRIGGNINTLASVTNSGTIQGGTGSTGVGGDGVQLAPGFNALTNTGTIIGGNGVTGGWGVNITGSSVHPAVLTNSGTITGGNNSSTSGGGLTGAGVIVHTNVGTITNSGTITGGSGAAAVVNTGANISLLNSGTLNAGAGWANAIQMQGTQTLSLELDKGSVINGAVVANAGQTNTLILGGDSNASFDISTVGPQYQNFTVFNKTGASTWTLTGTASTATPWTISTGTLQIGDGTATGTLIGDVTDNATLAFDRSDTSTYAGAIGGTGGVNQIGTGTTILTGTATYTGATSITAGTLQVNGVIAGSGVTVTGGTLLVNGSVASSAVAIGTGGTVLVNSGGTITSATITDGGLLDVNGSATSAVTVQGGGTLKGSGTVGATTIQSGGTIAPGNSIGTLHVNGAFVQAAGSTYQVEVDPGSSNADLIAVNGTATLQSGAGLNVTQNPAGQYQVGTVYKVLTASGGVSGTYALSGQTTSASAFLGLKDSYDSNNVYLTVVKTSDPVTAATTPNQTATATGVDSLPVTNPVTTAVLNSTSAAGARSAFDQLSGQVQASGQGALLANGLYVRDVAFDRLRDVVCVPGSTRNDSCDGKQLSIWAQGFGGWGGIAGNGNAAGLNHFMAGVLVGVDVPVDDWRLGFFGGYDRSDFNVIGNGAVGSSNDYHLGVYGGTLLGGFALRLGASYSFDDISTDRAVAIGSFSDNLRGLYTGGTVQAFGELGYGIDLNAVSLEPFANLAYVSLRTGAFTEAGGPAALSVAANTTEDTVATLGVRPSTAISLGGFDATLRGMIGWRRTFGQVTPDAQVAFAGGSSFSVTGAPIARNAAAVEAGVDVAILQDVSFGLTYGGQFSSRTTDQTGWGTIRVSF